MALFGNDIYAADDLSGTDRAPALATAVADLQRLRAESPAMADSAFLTYLLTAEAGTLQMLAEYVPTEEAGALPDRAAGLALQNIRAMDAEAKPLEVARAQIIHSMTAERITILDQTSEAMSASAAMFERDGMTDRWAAAQGGLGRIRHELGQYRDGADGEADLLAAIEAYRAAQTVRTREADPSGWAALQIDLLIAEDSCSRNSACGSRNAALERAYDHAIAAAAVYAQIGDGGHGPMPPSLPKA